MSCMTHNRRASLIKFFINWSYLECLTGYIYCICSRVSKTIIILHVFCCFNQEWGASCPHKYIAAYRLEHDMSWTSIEDLDQRSTDIAVVDKIYNARISESDPSITIVDAIKSSEFLKIRDISDHAECEKLHEQTIWNEEYASCWGMVRDACRLGMGSTNLQDTSCILPCCPLNMM